MWEGLFLGGSVVSSMREFVWTFNIECGEETCGVKWTE